MWLTSGCRSWLRVLGRPAPHDDANGSGSDNLRIDQVSLHMETLEARMDFEQDDVPAEAVQETAHLTAEGHQAGSVSDASQFTDEVQREYATVLAILLTGRMDHRLVEMPGPTAVQASPSWKPPPTTR